MQDDTITQANGLEANNPVNGANIETPLYEGDSSVEPQAETIKKDIEERKYTQKELDNIAAKARGSAERETTKRIMQQLGMSSYDEDALYAMREAYENSLTDAELRDQEFDDLNEENINLMVELDEKDYIIQALIAMSGKSESDVQKIVKMAQGLKTEDNTVADCIKEVMEMMGGTSNKPQSQMPVSQTLNQPSSSVMIDAATNPFRPGSINLTAQGRLWKENPELARKLAGEAGIKLNF